MYNFTFNIPTKIHFGKDTISSLSELKVKCRARVPFVTQESLFVNENLIL